MNHGWWWHLFNDSVRDNPWSLVAMVLIAPALFGLFWLEAALRQRWRQRKARR